MSFKERRVGKECPRLCRSSWLGGRFGSSGSRSTQARTLFPYTAVTVTLSNGQTITIEAGKTSGTVVFETPANDVYNNGLRSASVFNGAPEIKIKIKSTAA
ncbi:immunoglobulin-like domain-containing protein [Pseudomonas tolaasii]|uniref:immunoglobulin-like domain-containing protein n=1 Tax=Pseudomonas tolaasii TaxID=29442 RepID=UPI0012DB2211|nr:immunoglobulin-like domain-containing protein [Pseudomonas tolaasii]